MTERKIRLSLIWLQIIGIIFSAFMFISIKFSDLEHIKESQAEIKIEMRQIAECVKQNEKDVSYIRGRLNGSRHE